MNRSVTKGELNKLAIEIVRLEGRMDARLDALERTISMGFSGLAKMLEDYSGQVGKLDRRQVITDHRIDLLEKRLNALERKVS